jgi:dTDP-glucose pyrophosphorylase
MRLRRQCELASLSSQLLACGDDPWFRELETLDRRVTMVEAPSTGEWSAVKACLDACDWASGCVVVSTDNVFSDADFAAFVQTSLSQSSLSRLAVEAKPGLFGLSVVYPAQGNVVQDLVEKPDITGPGLAKAGLYFLAAASIELVLASGPQLDRFGEESMTQAFRSMGAAGQTVLYSELNDGFVDIGTHEGLRSAGDFTRKHDRRSQDTR